MRSKNENMKTSLVLMLGAVSVAILATSAHAGAPPTDRNIVVFNPNPSPPSPKDSVPPSLEEIVRAQMREFEEKAKQSTDALEAVGKSTAAQEVNAALRQLHENPKDLGNHALVARCMLKRIEEIERPLRTLIVAGFAETRDQLVTGLNLLGESQGRRSESFKMRGATDERFMTLSGVVSNFDLSYRELAKGYERIPIADQLKQIEKDLGYLGAVKDVLMEIEKHADVLKNDQQAIDALTKLSSTLAELEGSLLEFSDTVLQGVLFPTKEPKPAPIQ